MMMRSSSSRDFSSQYLIDDRNSYLYKKKILDFKRIIKIYYSQEMRDRHTVILAGETYSAKVTGQPLRRFCSNSVQQVLYIEQMYTVHYITNFKRIKIAWSLQCHVGIVFYTLSHRVIVLYKHATTHFSHFTWKGTIVRSYAICKSYTRKLEINDYTVEYCRGKYCICFTEKTFLKILMDTERYCVLVTVRRAAFFSRSTVHNFITERNIHMLLKK